MPDYVTFADLESPLVEEPLFPVEDWRVLDNPRKDLGELDRQSQFISFMRTACPHITVMAVPNAGKRGPKAQRQAKREGMLKGAFDTIAFWDIDHAHPDCPATVAHLEFKGFDARGKAGKLSPEQIDFGNKLHRQGHKVACFFSARTAVEWLRSLGAPIGGRIMA